jgi:hypothetical protein
MKTIWPEAYDLAAAVVYIEGKRVDSLAITKEAPLPNEKENVNIQLGYKRSYIQTQHIKSNLFEKVEERSKVTEHRRKVFHECLMKHIKDQHMVMTNLRKEFLQSLSVTNWDVDNVISC